MTGNIRYAGTDANVYIIMIGTLGKSHEIQLDDGKNNFEKGDTDVFKVSQEIGNPFDQTHYADPL